MKFLDLHRLRQRIRSACRFAVVGIAGAVVGQAFAASSLSDAPLFTASGTSIKPNIMFILDDSGSMQWDFMPDAADTLVNTMHGRFASQCNGLAYDPGTAYTPPFHMTGTPPVATSEGDADISAWIKPDPALQTRDQLSVTSLSVNPAVGSTVDVVMSASGMYFGTNAGTQDMVTVFKDANNYFVARVNVSGGSSLRLAVVSITGTIAKATTGLKVGKGEPVTGEYFTYKGKQPKLAWYTNSGSVDTKSTFYTECTKLVKDGSTVFDKINAATQLAKDQQNYANWAKYYRTRMQTMQSASSVAFQGVTDRYRVGYSTIGQPSAVPGVSDFLDIEDFDATQKKAFYDKLFASKPSDTGTPLRGALSKAGKYFAKKAEGQVKDPIQFSCQRNFSILSTDGYWNNGAQRADEVTARDAAGTAIKDAKGNNMTSTYGARGLDGALVGNVDDKLPRPMADGTTLKSTTTEKWSVVEDGRWQIVTGTEAVSTKTTYTKSPEGIVKKEVFTYRYQDSAKSCGNGNKNRRIVQVTRTVDTTGYLDQTVVEETRTPTTTTEVTSRKQQTDFQRVVVIDNGKVISDTPTQTTTTLSDVLETTTGPTAGTPTKSGSDTGLVRRETSTKTTDTGATNVDCLAPNTAGYPKTSNYVVTYPPPAGTGTTQVGTASSTVPLPRKEGWIGTPAANKTDVETTAEFESTNGVGNTLADVAAYYYETDLRDAKWSNCTNTGGKDVCTNNVPGTALKDPYKSFGDSQRQQHMTTFTLGLGVSGSLDFDPRYQLLRSGDFHDIVNLARNWPNTTASSNSTVDDLWHAAVNGRGQYFSAGNPAALTAGINAALAAIDTVVGAASAASTSSLQPVEGDNDIYVAQFTTKQWIGDVLAYKIDPNNGDISKTFTWSAQARLELADPAKRTIYYRSPKTNGLTSFTHTNLSTDGLNGLFDNFCSLAKASAVGTGGPLQCATLTDTDKTSANNGDNLVKYLRGDQTMTYYRTRTARLGDIINASPLFVGKPAFKYTENDYGKFATANVGRTAVVLAAANDGMLHALDRGTGNELWAYIPSFVMENMPKLADEAFQNSHSYFVDGSPQMGDVYDAGAKEWKTIVVGGLNKGGRGYYALDLTDPTAPKVLWEFSHANLGYTYGNPIITKRKNGEWVVVFASGYDNGSSVGGDGNGHLFVLDALTGKEVVLHGQSIVDTAGGISTMDSSGNPAGTAAKPSGMAKINVWVDSETNNTARRFYGGDELGNLWRFDIDGEVAPNGKALLLAQLQLPAGTPQPITTKPVLAELEYNGSRHSVVYVATGTYMRTDDPKATGVQSVYAIKDPLIDQPYGDLRNGSFAGKFVVQVITAGEDAKKNPTRSSTAKTVDWTTMAGWRADFPVGGERVSVNPQIALDTLFVGSNLPKDEDCSVGGNSFLYQFNILTGKASAVYVGNVLLQGLTLVQLVKGASAGSIETIITRSDGKLQKEIGDPPEVIGTLRRTSWREIVD